MLVLAGIGDGTICMWEVSTSRLLGQFLNHHRGVNSMVFTPDSRGFLSGSWDRAIKFWEIDFNILQEVRDGGLSVENTPEQKNCAKCTYSVVGHKDSVVDVSISPDGQWVTSASGDQTLLLWDRSLTPRLMLRGHKDLGELTCYTIHTNTTNRYRRHYSHLNRLQSDRRTIFDSKLGWEGQNLYVSCISTIHLVVSLIFH
jgi:WD40 repeat protein